MTTGGSADEERLCQIIRSCPWLIGALGVVRQVGLPDAWIGAGVIRDLVWGERYGPGFDPAGVHDIDVVFFDPRDLGRDRDERATQALCAAGPELPWQARNQAAVHRWYANKFGGEPVGPLSTIVEAVAT